MFVIKPRFSYSKTIYFLRVTCHTKDSKIRNLWHSKEKVTQIVTSIELLHSNCSEWQRLHRLVGIVSAPFASVVILLAAFLVKKKSGWRMTFPPRFFKRAFRLEAAGRNVGKKKNHPKFSFVEDYWTVLHTRYRIFIQRLIYAYKDQTTTPLYPAQHLNSYSILHWYLRSDLLFSQLRIIFRL